MPDGGRTKAPGTASGAVNRPRSVRRLRPDTHLFGDGSNGLRLQVPATGARQVDATAFGAVCRGSETVLSDAPPLLFLLRRELGQTKGGQGGRTAQTEHLGILRELRIDPGMIREPPGTRRPATATSAVYGASRLSRNRQSCGS